MPFEPIAPEKRADAVIRQIELLILRGVLRPGERLPPERELAERMAVSRPSLREALATLQERGLLTTRPSAGIFVAEVLGSAFSAPLIALFGAHEEAVLDYVSFRRDLEGMAAERAARAGSDTDLALIDTVFGKMEAAHQRRRPDDEAHLDAEFHMAVVEAGHNVIMLHMMRSMFALLREGVLYNRQTLFRQRATRSALLDQHRAIRDAILARDPDAAREAMHRHLGFVEAGLLEAGRKAQNEDTARKKLEREQDR
ncbi:GntR family transcriptional regulator [Roseovarius sp. 22II1-1F6A]|nr:GntR family transcriptional regulator [Roseovarius sp. 22II1-1F6A]